jgi:hypothetical protein
MNDTTWTHGRLEVHVTKADDANDNDVVRIDDGGPTTT